jgi:hypothetical protein
MNGFHMDRNGCAVASFAPEEAALLVQLAGESAELIDRARHDDAVRTDPAVIRLLPDAYPDDPAASAEFRRYTTDGLAQRKILNARVVVEMLAGSDGADPIVVRVDDAAALAWLRTITDIRLILGARLGIVQDGDEGDIHDDETALLRALFDWLAFLQETLIDVLDASLDR